MIEGYQWLEDIAKSMNAARDNGAAPTPTQLTVRDLLGQFGYLRRGSLINSEIFNGLEKYHLSTEPDFTTAWIDSLITVCLDSDRVDTSKIHAMSDPTPRIESLEAANKRPISVSPDNSLDTATTIMQLNDYSQLPVVTSEHNVKGIISWESIGARLSLGCKCEYVRDCMDPAKEMRVDAPLLDAIPTIAEDGYVLVRGMDNTITGIVTASDLSLQFMQLTGPFLLVGEIEGHLRHLIHGKFKVEQLRSAASSEGERPIEGSGDLTFGDYCRLLESKNNWKVLGLNIDRSKFVTHLDEVRKIRNDVMHFNPDGLSEDQARKLRDMARFFRELGAYRCNVTTLLRESLA